MLSRQIQIKSEVITIEQDLSLSHAGTVWDGALVLAYYLAKHEKLAYEYFSGKCILQLGSGTGILGMVVALFEPKTLWLTDFQQFLPIIQKNREINKKIIKGTKMIISSLKWGNKEEMSKIKQVDWIIGSQLAYDSQNIGYLLETMVYFAKQNKNVKILISYQKYENPNRNLFERVCKVSQLKCTQIGSDDMHDQYRDDGVGILLITSAF